MPLTQPQQAIVDASQRFRVVIAGRRFGKTFLAIRELAYHTRMPNQLAYYVAPSYRMAKTIVWKTLKHKLMDIRWLKKANETAMELELKNGSIIALKGADNPDSLRGVGLDFLVMDEFADIDEKAWTETLRATLADRQGRALFIGTPKGMNWAKDMFDLAQEFPDEWASFQYTTEQGGNVSLAEIEAARRTLDEKTFNQEFRATFETFTGRVFYAFDRQHNLKPFEGPLPHELHIGMDFNVDNNSAIVFAKNNNVLHAFDEIKLMGSNTDEMVQEIQNRYPKNRIVVYPDPAGAQRKTSAGGKTDHSILRAAGFTVKSRNVTESVRDGINAVNAKLCSSTGARMLFIDPRCKYTIESLEKHTYKPNSSIPDKSSGYDHFSDALRYCVEFLFPIRQEVTPPPFRMWTHRISS